MLSCITFNPAINVFSFPVSKIGMFLNRGMEECPGSQSKELSQPPDTSRTHFDPNNHKGPLEKHPSCSCPPSFSQLLPRLPAPALFPLIVALSPSVLCSLLSLIKSARELHRALLEKPASRALQSSQEREAWWQQCRKQAL